MHAKVLMSKWQEKRKYRAKNVIDRLYVWNEWNKSYAYYMYIHTYDSPRGGSNRDSVLIAKYSEQ